MKWGILLIPFLLFANGYDVYKKYCSSCHLEYYPFDILKKNFMEYNNTLLNLKAPTINQISFRLKQKIGNSKGDKEFHKIEVVEFIKDYVKNPNKNKSVCMDEIISIFNTMPKIDISDDKLEEVAQWIYDKKFDTTLKVFSFNEALKKAKKEDKIIIVFATSKDCYYCKKMEESTLKDPEILSYIDKYFIFVPIDVYKNSLPLGLKWKMTPTFFFIDKEKNILKIVPGAWDKKDFLEILKRVKK